MNRIESQVYSLVTHFLTREVCVIRLERNPADPNGLLYEASVALQGLPIQLTDLSRMRERDPLVLQHKRPRSALGQAHFQASGATELTIWDANPTPFQFSWRPNLLGM